MNANFYKRYYFKLLAIYLIQFLIHSPTTAKEEGESCEASNGAGICMRQSRCAELGEVIMRGERVRHCGYSLREEIICCPTSDGNNGNKSTAVTDRLIFVSGPDETSGNMISERPAVRACREIEANLTPGLTLQILGGIPADLGEYPHMAAIGFRSSLNETSSYTFNCGGTLIDKRFVLTAAHCVNKRDLIPAIVRLGIVDFSDPLQLRDAVEIPIKRLHIHPEYSGSSAYHDIALLELENDVTYTKLVYPTCLYSDIEDPQSNARLEVTGWGTINITTRQISNILLKARLNIVPLENCNETYAALGFTRQIRKGLLDTQLCAVDPGEVSDACQGDSGGPLNLVVDESLKQYRILGIISTGFSCGGRIPGLYTRVAAYLDFIESIVWPT